jgi:hypothetical protein
MAGKGPHCAGFSFGARGLLFGISRFGSTIVSAPLFGRRGGRDG